MKNKKSIFIVIFVYGVLCLILLLQNVLLASEKKVVSINAKQPKQQQDFFIVEDNRSQLRAFYTAPPVVPHEVESEEYKKCLDCHLKVTKLEDGRVASQTPHPQFSNCLQCHVSAKRQSDLKEVLTWWKGLEEPKRGNRGYLMSPPTIPHRIFLRENCLSCHGPDNPDMQIRTTHPQRRSCLQCHVPDYSNEFKLEEEY